MTRSARWMRLAMLPGLVASMPVAAVHAEAPRRLQAGAELSYAFATGGLERGSQLGDVSYGIPQLGLEAAYAITRDWSAGLVGRYGLNIPTLCASSSDCVASLGHQWSIAVGGGFRTAAFGIAHPAVELELGYQWLATQLSDVGAVSRRGFRGWYAALRGDFLFDAFGRLAIGPTLSCSVGRFDRATLSAPGVHGSRPTEGSALHVWPTLGVRTQMSW